MRRLWVYKLGQLKIRREAVRQNERKEMGGSRSSKKKEGGK